MRSDRLSFVAAPVLALLSGCSLIQAQGTAEPLLPVVVPRPSSAQQRPAIFLIVQNAPTPDASGSAVSQAETDGRLVTRIEGDFIAHARRLGLFADVYSDPFDAPRADYHVHIDVRWHPDPHLAAKASVAGATYGLVTANIRSETSLVVELRDRNDKPLATETESNAQLIVQGLGALAVAKPAVGGDRPKDIEEQLVLKALRFLTMQRIYRPAKPATAAARPAPAVPSSSVAARP